LIGRAAIAFVVVTSLASRADANDFPARLGQSGILDVPDAETAPLGGGRLSGELRFDRAPGLYSSAGLLPLSIVSGLGKSTELGFALREWGQPGDPIPSPTLFTFATKLRLVEGSGNVPSFAISLSADRVNWKAVLGGRVVASTADLGGRLRFAAFAGAEGLASSPHSVGPTGGLAATFLHRSDLQTALEAFAGPRGAAFSGAFAWSVGRGVGLSIGATWLPAEGGLRMSLGFTAASTPKGRRAEPSKQEASKPTATEATKTAGPLFTDDRPHFRMTIHQAGMQSAAEPRHVQYAMAPAGSEAARGAPLKRTKAVVNVDEQRERDLLALAEQLETREKRLHSADAALANRQDRLAGDRQRLQGREQTLRARGAAIDAREIEIGAPGRATERELELAEAEDQIRSTERELALQARQALEAVDGGTRRERAASQREEQLRPDASRPAEARSFSAKPAQQLDARAQALGARDTYLGALEERLAATRDRLEALERHLRAEADRLDAFERRLSTKLDRLAAVERRARGKSEAPPAVAQAPVEDTARPARSASAGIAMIVRQPTSIALTGSTATAPAAPATSGDVGEKTVAAAAFVQLPVARQALKDEDRDSVGNVAKVVARDGGEVLVWARAQNPSLIEEASRRAEELKAFVVTAGPLPSTIVKTRVTVRPSTTGVDVVVSALRSERRTSSADAADKLAAGEAGKRQIRDAMKQFGPEIAGCLEAEIAQRGLQRADAVLKLKVDARGRVIDVVSAQGDLSGPPIDACLRRGSVAWRLPVMDGEYAFEVPVTAVLSGAKP
jgi:hypothetical protein